MVDGPVHRLIDCATLVLRVPARHCLLDYAGPRLIYTAQRPFKSNPERLKKVALMTVKIAFCWLIKENLPG